MARCFANLRSLAACAKEHDTIVWIDMEQHAYVDATLETYRRVLADFPNVGVCLQAYLYRTANDLTTLFRTAHLPASARQAVCGW